MSACNVNAARKNQQATFGRKIAGRIAIDMFFNELPVIVKSALLYDNLNSEELYNHIETSVQSKS